jgi:hypothetical protein
MIFLLFHGVSEASTFYVRTDGNNSICNGLADASATTAPNCAKTTIQASVDLAYAGDTVIVRSGNYSSFSTTRSGSAGQLISIRGASGETVNVSKISAAHPYNKIEGFRVTGGGGQSDPAIKISAANTWIYRNIIRGNGIACWGVATYPKWYNDLIIEGNIFEGDNTAGTTFEVCINIGGNNNRITRNVFRGLNGPERAIEFYGHSVLIDYNEGYNWNMTLDWNKVHPDIFQIASNAGSTGVVIENNYFHDLGPAQIGNIFAEGNFEWTFRNNIFANVGAGIRAYVNGLKFYNNLFFNCANAFPSEKNAILFGGYYTGNTDVRNNSFVGCGYGDSNNSGFHNGKGGYNFVSTITGGAKTGLYTASNDVVGGNLGFFNPNKNCYLNNCNFQITDQSSMVMKGVAISEFSVDYLGAARPSNESWDIGPFQGSRSSGLISNPKGLHIKSYSQD